ncbi:phasin family protein [Novosphingobium aquiterrae]|uniref:Phasin family protein n=1 Tax=Novosphingobium aquiterrae TaxID=624388 RepID=A0ABV6PK24_9SPHN
MAEATEAKIDAAKAAAEAEKAYAAASEKVEAKPVVVAKAAEAAPAAAPKAEKPAAAPKAAPKTAKAKPVARKAAAKATVVKKAAPKKIAKPAAAKAVKPAARANTLTQIKDTLMTKTKTTTEDFTAKVKDAMTEAQDRAKLAFEKSQAVFGDAGEFTKGNVEALVESGKILAAGLQDMGKDYVADAKTAFEVVQDDVKSLAAVKSPTDFFKLQGEILRRNFDAAVATGSKRSEAMLKLANDAFAPLSTRVSLAVEKVKQAA